MATVLNMFGLGGRVAVVTGASSGLGVEAALALAQAGAHLVLAARRTDHLEMTAARVQELGVDALVVRTDVTRREDCNMVIERALERFGKVDVLVNNAGIASAVPATRELSEDFMRVIDVNLNGTYWMAQASGRVMKKGASIINIASVLGLRTFGLPQAAYSASKAAVIGLTRDLSSQWAGRKGIRVNAIAPGIFPSEMSAEFKRSVVEQVCSQTPMGRIGESGELMGPIVFLASDASSYITGITLPVDGGWSAP
jgi:NAD(P)-dependent dehydrogenase (short-subunit alcohol dehydrogenase family)